MVAIVTMVNMDNIYMYYDYLWFILGDKIIEYYL